MAARGDRIDGGFGVGEDIGGKSASASSTGTRSLAARENRRHRRGSERGGGKAIGTRPYYFIPEHFDAPAETGGGELPPPQLGRIRLSGGLTAALLGTLL